MVNFNPIVIQTTMFQEPPRSFLHQFQYNLGNAGFFQFITGIVFFYVRIKDQTKSNIARMIQNELSSTKKYVISRKLDLCLCVGWCRRLRMEWCESWFDSLSFFNPRQVLLSRRFSLGCDRNKIFRNTKRCQRSLTFQVGAKMRSHSNLCVGIQVRNSNTGSFVFPQVVEQHVKSCKMHRYGITNITTNGRQV